jgi:ribosomal protein S18 acetylase RimI-like enzyme
MPLAIEPLTPADHPAVERFMRERWPPGFVVAHGQIYHPAELPGFAARDGEALVGLVTYRVEGAECEIMTIDSLEPGRGIGTRLLEAAVGAGRAARCARLWLITTNDNLDALHFYQKRGFRLVALRPGAVDAARRLKPDIPLLGAHGIPLRDELELEQRLDR